jgi:hypothetical protein
MKLILSAAAARVLALTTRSCEWTIEDDRDPTRAATLLARKLSTRLPSFGEAFTQQVPLTRIRDIAHRNDIPSVRPAAAAAPFVHSPQQLLMLTCAVHASFKGLASCCIISLVAVVGFAAARAADWPLLHDMQTRRVVWTTMGSSVGQRFA